MGNTKLGKDANPLPEIQPAPTVANAGPIYRALTGFNYGCAPGKPEGTRVDVGCDVPADCPAKVIADLLGAGVIVEVKAK